MTTSSRIYALLSALAVAITAMTAVPAGATPVPDEKGVMMYDYGGSVGAVYNPKVVAQHGIMNYNNYRETGDLEARQNFVNAANWLVENAVDMGNYSIWQYYFRWSSYGGVEPPYASALAQSEGVYVLATAHNVTGDDRYLAEAKRAFGAFVVNYEEGGVASDEGRDSLFLQILAKPGLQKTYVLNGHTNSLFFIWKYYEYTHDYRALIVFGKGINWLLDNLQKYDSGEWSYYDQMNTKARSNYHQAHIIQLGRLYDITGDRLLQHYSERFASYAGQGL